MNAQTIMICSGKGGTGKSTVSVLLGAQLGAWGRRVLLIELDSGLRSVDMIAGVYGKTVYDIEDVLCGRCDGSKAIVPSPLYPGLSVISAPYEGGEVRAAPLAGLILAMREYFDYILLDTAAGMGAPFTAANRLADRALVVLTPDPAVHGRTRNQMYSGTANWDWIREVKKAVKIPVIANGDVFEPEDAVHILKYTGADMAMLGRGCFGNPWLFARAQAALEGRQLQPLLTAS